MSLKMGYQGIPGCYSEMAVQEYLSKEALANVEVVAFENFASLLEALNIESIDQVMIPIENSTTGLIHRTLDLIRYQPFVASHSLTLNIQHQLFALPQATLADLQAVYPHPEALSQCQHFFASYPAIKERTYFDTASSAQKVQDDQLINQGAIASKRAGELYGLVPLIENMQNEASNQTRFLVLHKRQQPSWSTLQTNRLFLYIETDHQPGALYRLLQVFDSFRCNLIGLNSRPITNKPFEYGFYIELELQEMYGKLEALEILVAHHSTYYQILGNYE